MTFKLFFKISLILFAFFIVTSCSDSGDSIPIPPEDDFDSDGYNSDRSQYKDFRDDNIYSIVEIGDQRWMGENLRFNADGSIFNSRAPEYYGRFYNWNIVKGDLNSSNNVNGFKGICPDGWHVPTDNEWKELELELGMDEDDINKFGELRGDNQGTQLKSILNWVNGGYGTNTSGFSAYPTGFMNSNEVFEYGDSAYFWTSTNTDSSGTLQAIFRTLRGSPTIARDKGDEDIFKSCRCIED